MADPPLHPDNEPLAFLLGTWSGEGSGAYPNCNDFGYGEETTFGHVGKAFLTYRQRTWALDDGRALHAEVGFLRPAPDGRVELVLAHPNGVAEIEAGSLERTTLRLATIALNVTPTAKPVSGLERDIQVTGDTLAYEVRMAAMGQPLQYHLNAALHRV